MARDIPLAEITLRKYEKPYKSDKRELVKKICLSLGLLQPGDSRDVIVDILSVLNDACREKKEISSEDIKKKVEEIRKEKNLGGRGVAESNIRRQLKRLRDLMLVEKKGNLYRLSEFASLKEIFNDKIKEFLIPQTIARIEEHLDMLDGRDSKDL